MVVTNWHDNDQAESASEKNYKSDLEMINILL